MLYLHVCILFCLYLYVYVVFFNTLHANTHHIHYKTLKIFHYIQIQIIFYVFNKSQTHVSLHRNINNVLHI